MRRVCLMLFDDETNDVEEIEMFLSDAHAQEFDDLSEQGFSHQQIFRIFLARGLLREATN